MPPFSFYDQYVLVWHPTLLFPFVQTFKNIFEYDSRNKEGEMRQRTSTYLQWFFQRVQFRCNMFPGWSNFRQIYFFWWAPSSACDSGMNTHHPGRDVTLTICSHAPWIRSIRNTWNIWIAGDFLWAFVPGLIHDRSDGISFQFATCYEISNAPQWLHHATSNVLYNDTFCNCAKEIFYRPHGLFQTLFPCKIIHKPFYFSWILCNMLWLMNASLKASRSFLFLTWFHTICY